MREFLPQYDFTRNHPAFIALPRTAAVSPLRLLSLSLTWLVITSFSMLELRADEPQLDPKGVEFFEKHVRPVLVKNCYECHSGEEIYGGLAVDSRPGLLQGGDSGAAILPGQPDQSLLIEAIRYKNQDLQMPPQNMLAAAEIEALEKWVAMGAPDPREAVPSEGGPAPTGMSLAEGRMFWSFQPIQNPSVPDVKQADWVKTPIDAFLLSKLEENQLSPAPAADKRTLIRRVTYNLTGLPPTPQEIEAFLADETPEAYQKVIDRLLASPQYGVRWGRHWLDVARYADSNGLDENLALGNAWRYRDYVIDSFNKDKPFNEFLVEQIAGDLIPHANEETITGTGFLVLGAKVLAEPDREKLEMDTIDEQLDTVGKAFLGMTLGCVRCHDHKFDPISHKDYYSLAAIFKSTRTFADSNTGAIKHWYEHPFATEEEQQKIKDIETEIAAKKRATSTFLAQARAKLRQQAQEQATDYLVAAVEFGPDMPLTEVTRIAEKKQLHPRILHHCRLHLSYHTDDPFFGKWHELASSEGAEGVERHFRPLFAEAEAAWAEAKKADPKVKTLADEQLELARAALHDASGFLAVPPKPEFAFDEETLTEYYRLMEEARVYESQAPDLHAVMGVSEGPTQATVPIHIRGSHRNLGEPVAREFPAVMRFSEVRPIFPKGQSGRLQLANWMASTQHPLTARVYVNRIWNWHFGTGIVNTPDNFGVLGDRPSHPELLDWLAYQFMESGWSTKTLHRLILTSNAYQMSSVSPIEETARLADPENRLLWKFQIQRLEAEEIRDAILAVSGRLDTTLAGKTVPLRNRQFVFDHTSIDHTKYDSLRRAVYLPVIRNNVYTFFEQFDFPDPTMPTGSRNATVVAPQALLLMNADLVMDSAQELAKQLLTEFSDPEQRIQIAYEKTLARKPTQTETERAQLFVNGLTAQALTNSATVDPTQEELAWSLFCQSLFASNEFIYLK